MNSQAMPEQRGGRGWRFLGCVTGVVFLAAAGFFVLLALGIMTTFKSGAYYKDSLAAVQANAHVVELVGEPMEPGFLVTGSVRNTLTNGTANIAYSISGPRGKGRVQVRANQSDDQWTLQSVIVKVGDRETINVISTSMTPPPSEPAPEEKENASP